LLALAFNAKTYKLKFGHRGGNHPVKSATEKMKSPQNHGFAGDLKCDKEVTLVERRNERGFCHKTPLFSQYSHPEASPGPHDSDYLLYFMEMMKPVHRLFHIRHSAERLAIGYKLM
jgi:carbamoyl-phosphate synthase small subunit